MNTPQKRPILCLDFDGVVHSYTSPWVRATHIPDPPVPGALQFISAAQEHFAVQIFSSRSNEVGGISAMVHWLRTHLTAAFGPVFADTVLGDIVFPLRKPPAHLTIDDRVVLFEGAWPDLQKLKEFKPWNKR